MFDGIQFRHEDRYTVMYRRARKKTLRVQIADEFVRFMLKKKRFDGGLAYVIEWGCSCMSHEDINTTLDEQKNSLISSMP